MARLWHAGAEFDITGGAESPDGGGGSGLTRDTATKRSGAASWKFDSVTGVQTPQVVTNFTYRSGLAGAGSMYFRFYILSSDTFAVDDEIFTDGLVTQGVRLKLTTAGKIAVYDDTINRGTSTTSVNDGVWHRVEFRVDTDAGGTSTGGEVRIDGVSEITWTAAGVFASSGNIRFGYVAGFNIGGTKVMYIDDVALQNSTGAANNSWPGDGKVLLMPPISDVARGVWTGGAGGTTNLWDALNNNPPVGVADPGTNTSQIKVKSTTLPTTMQVLTDTFTNLGIGASDTIKALSVYASHGEDPATGTKVGSVGFGNNPVSASPTVFNYGNDAGAQGTYNAGGSQWWWASDMEDAPTVAKGTGVRLDLICTSGSTGTRAASCCALVAYVDYAPAVAAAKAPPPSMRERRVRRSLVSR